MNSKQKRLDYLHLEEAYNIASRARGNTFPNPVVGAIIARGEQVIATGFHQKAGDAHAEAIAINAASGSLDGATLYTTLEPCSYDGADKRTPPCVTRILESDIKRVVIGAIDPNERENGRATRILKRHIEVVRIDMRAQFVRQNEGYVVRMRHKRPLIEVKLAQTIDGYSADSQHSSQWISDPGAIKFAHHIRARHDAILIGGRTALHDNPRLTARFGLNAYPIRIVLDRQMALPLSLKLFGTAKKVGTYLIYDEKTANEKKMHQLAKMGVHVVGFDMDAEDFYSRLFGYFYTHTICNSILVEGGALTVSRIVERGIWDRISMVLCPMLLLGGVHMRADSAWRLSETKKIDKSIWYSLTHFNSQCMAFRGYKNCTQSFGIGAARYPGDWYV